MPKLPLLFVEVPGLACTGLDWCLSAEPEMSGCSGRLETTSSGGGGAGLRSSLKIGCAIAALGGSVLILYAGFTYRGSRNLIKTFFPAGSPSSSSSQLRSQICPARLVFPSEQVIIRQTLT